MLIAIKLQSPVAALDNNMRENATRVPHQYAVGDKVLIVLRDFERRNQRKIVGPISKGPYMVVKVNNNGTI